MEHVHFLRTNFYVSFQNELIDQDMSPISNMIAENQSLKKLFLGSNEIRDAGLAELGVGLSENKSILEIDLSRNKIRGENREYIYTNKFIILLYGYE